MVERSFESLNSHSGQPLRTAGEPLGSARAAMVMLHSRGAQAEDILSLADQLAQPGFVYFAPQAAHNSGGGGGRWRKDLCKRCSIAGIDA